MRNALSLVVVFVGSGLGGVARYLLSVVVDQKADPTFPWGTLTVNCLGSLVIGVLAGHWARHTAPEDLQLFAMVGVLGGFTTFSSFSVQVVNLVQKGDWPVALGYVGGTVVANIGLCAIGYVLAKGA